jgi:NAD-dependent dihydropyrimidine dehydrogenase PreA subunit
MLTIREERCVGCGQCVPFCPVDALRAWGMVELDKEVCTECLVCVEYCPVDALEATDEVGKV